LFPPPLGQIFAQLGSMQIFFANCRYHAEFWMLTITFHPLLTPRLSSFLRFLYYNKDFFLLYCISNFTNCDIRIMTTVCHYCTSNYHVYLQHVTKPGTNSTV
jgi:hypothetical protein